MPKRCAALLLALCLCLVPMRGLAEEEEIPVPEGYIPICDRDELEAIQNTDGKYMLAADIDLSEGDWMPIDFHGTLDGNGHTLYNMTITQPGANTVETGDGNHKLYDTCFAAFIANGADATLCNLHLLNVEVNVTTDTHCFAAAVMGNASNTVLRNITAESRVRLTQSAVMAGVSGLVGYGWGEITDCQVETELVFADTNTGTDCEEFMGGLLACGYADIADCTAYVRGYASVHGYCHNGGLVGMHHIHPNSVSHKGYVKNNSVDAEISFFEDVRSRRAYCKAVIGETLNKAVTVSNNTTLHFAGKESKNFNTLLQPETCAAPVYTDTVTQSTCNTFGYTFHTCNTCGYSYKDSYTPPAHHFDEGTIVEPTCTEKGYLLHTCTLCGEQLQDSFTEPVHQYDEGVVIPPTCTAEGYTVYTCTVCGESFRNHPTPPAHTPGKWKQETPPSGSQPGKEVLRCTVCRQILDSRELPQLEYITQLQLNHSSLLLLRNSGVQLQAIYLPENPANTYLTWVSSNPSVASVDSNGTVLSHRKGTAIITCSALEGGATAQCSIRVEYNWQQWVLYYAAFGWIWFR